MSAQFPPVISSKEHPNLLLKAMRPEHIEAVRAVEAHCFSTVHSAQFFEQELTNNRLSHYWIVHPKATLLSSVDNHQGMVGVAAYGGSWLLGDELHIITIATHPQWQRNGLGRWLLSHMLVTAYAQGASTALLEVRASNQAAIALYTRFGFLEVGRRKRYYRDNGEDALLFSLPSISNAL